MLTTLGTDPQTGPIPHPLDPSHCPRLWNFLQEIFSHVFTTSCFQISKPPKTNTTLSAFPKNRNSKKLVKAVHLRDGIGAHLWQMDGLNFVPWAVENESSSK